MGCGERNGQKYFLVRFKGGKNSEIVDWETAKQYSVDVMEFFGSRLVWKSMDEILDPEHGDNLNPEHDDNVQNQPDLNEPSTSKNAVENTLAKKKNTGNKTVAKNNPLPNDIEYCSSSSD